MLEQRSEPGAADGGEELTKCAFARGLVWDKKRSAGFAVDPAQHRVVRVVTTSRDSSHNDVRTWACCARVVVEESRKRQ